MKAVVTVGISASGKSTWADEWALKNNALVSNRDNFRFSITGAKNWSEYKFNRHIEYTITKIQDDIARYAHDCGKNLVVSDTNLNPKYRNALIDKLKDIGFEIEIKNFPITLEEALHRDSLRCNGVGKGVIYKQYQQWLDYSRRKTYKKDTSLPRAIIVDVDGTLASMYGNRTAFEWDKVGTDKPRDIIIQMVRHAFGNTHRIIVVSGRDAVCLPETSKWLFDNEICYDDLFMRKKGDMRKDTIVKEEIFWEHIAPYNCVDAAFDDRPSVVRLWHEIGIENVIAVADQNIEF